MMDFFSSVSNLHYLCIPTLKRTSMFGKRNTAPIKRLLVIRFSAMGDVAMTTPVVYALASQHPELRITVLTRHRLVPLFEWMPANVQARGVDLKEHDGVIGLAKLYRQLRKGHFDAVADLHDVLRSKYLCACFRACGTRVVTVDKGRKEKKGLTGKGSSAASLTPMIERYADVFREMGLSVDLQKKKMYLDLRGESYTDVYALTGRKQAGDTWIGVAPFAAHMQKIYPLEKMHAVVKQLADIGHKVFLFGAGESETEELETWEQKNVVSTCGKLGGLKNEMLLMSRLNLMISMDSANMHIASMLSVPVLSIWGATHPKAGFGGYGQHHDNAVQRDLPCRPCSIYGNKPCQYGDLRCMDISPETIVEKVLNM